jgi:uncharacterized protein
MDDEHKLKFPCQFPIKVMGKARDDFEIAVLDIVHKHFPNLTENSLSTRLSKNGNYMAITITVNAISQDQLDAAYRELSSHDLVVMAL